MTKQSGVMLQSDLCCSSFRGIFYAILIEHLTLQLAPSWQEQDRPNPPSHCFLVKQTPLCLIWSLGSSYWRGMWSFWGSWELIFSIFLCPRLFSGWRFPLTFCMSRRSRAIPDPPETLAASSAQYPFWPVHPLAFRHRACLHWHATQRPSFGWGPMQRSIHWLSLALAGVMILLQPPYTLC